MRAVIQRVANASVTGMPVPSLLAERNSLIKALTALVNDEVISSIGKGLMVLVGIGKGPLVTSMIDGL